MKLNKYTIVYSEEFEIELADDNNVIKIDPVFLHANLKTIVKIYLYVIEGMNTDSHINKFKFVKVGEEISENEDWIYIDSIGDSFLFQRRNGEGGK